MKRRNYCTLAPDWLPFLGWFGWTCCKQHDELYEYGGDEAARLYADRLLAKCMNDYAKEKGPLARWIAKRAGFVYFRAVRRFGRSHFNYWDIPDRR